MLGLGWFRLGCGEDGAGLVEVAAFVGGDGVEASGERETEKFEEGILEADGGEIEVGVGAQEILGVDVRGEERGGDVGLGVVWGLIDCGDLDFILGGGSRAATNFAPKKPGSAGRRRSLLSRRATAATGCIVAR
jgi:hypothetical protein